MCCSNKDRAWPGRAGARRSKRRLEARGFRAHLFNPGKEKLGEVPFREILEASHIVSSIPPATGSDPVQTSYRGELPKWTSYLSSASIYGDWQGKWVDKETSRDRWRSERWRGLSLRSNGWNSLKERELVCACFAWAGFSVQAKARSISFTLDTIRRGSDCESRNGSRKRFTSSVHIADICRVFRKAMVLNCSPGATVYNVVDDDPSPRAEVMAYSRRLLNVEDDDLSSNNEL